MLYSIAAAPGGTATSCLAQIGKQTGVLVSTLGRSGFGTVMMVPRARRVRRLPGLLQILVGVGASELDRRMGLGMRLGHVFLQVARGRVDDRRWPVRPRRARGCAHGDRGCGRRTGADDDYGRG